MLTLVIILKAVAEIAGLALLGQGILFVLAGGTREQNVFYRVLRTITSPATRFTRAITPRFVGDAHIGLATFFLVAGLWLALTLIKIRLVFQAASALGS